MEFKIVKNEKIILSCFTVEDTMDFLKFIPYKDLKKIMVYYRDFYHLNGNVTAYDFLKYLF